MTTPQFADRSPRARCVRHRNNKLCLHVPRLIQTVLAHDRLLVVVEDHHCISRIFSAARFTGHEIAQRALTAIGTCIANSSFTDITFTRSEVVVAELLTTRFAVLDRTLFFDALIAESMATQFVSTELDTLSFIAVATVVVRSRHRRKYKLTICQHFYFYSSPWHSSHDHPPSNCRNLARHEAQLSN